MSPKSVLELWNQICTDLKPVNGLSLDRENKINNLIRSPLDSIKKWEMFFTKINDSSFLRGEVQAFQATFDWVIKPHNAVKILDGNYDDREVYQFDPVAEMDKIIEGRKNVN